MAYERTLMTPHELKRRYEPDKALALSIEKWVRLGYKENWERLIRVEGGRYVGIKACGLCIKYRADSLYCGECPLRSEGRLVGCDDTFSFYAKAIAALENKDRKKFMKYRGKLLNRMRRAYARGER